MSYFPQTAITDTNGAAIAVGQTTKSASLPVTIASDQGAIAVTASAGMNLNTSALALETGGNLATIAGSAIAQASTTSGQKGYLELGAVTTAAPTYTTAQSSPISLTTAGGLRSDLSSVGATAFTLGQKVAASSIPVTLASDNGITQSAVSPGTTSAPSATIVVAGKSNDTTPKYSVIPLGPNGQSVLTQPYTGNIISGTATTTGTADTSVIAAQGAANKVYMTGFSVYNSGTTAAVITFKNGAGGATLWTTMVPAGGISNLDMPSPVATALNTGLYFAASASSTTIGVAVCGFYGP
jgi:hypothetical protein